MSSSAGARSGDALNFSLEGFLNQKFLAVKPCGYPRKTGTPLRSRFKYSMDPHSLAYWNMQRRGTF